MKDRLVLCWIVVITLLVACQRCKQPAGEQAVNEIFRDTHHLVLTKHARCRMDCRHITDTELKTVIHTGNVNYSKSGEGSKGDKTYALEGYSDEHQHLRVVVAPESDGLVVITCIDLDHEWPCNCY
jgi:Domain of unknown function (DUF4258)